MKKLYILAGLLAGITACSAPKPDLGTDKCAEILFQMHRADAIISVKGFNDRSLNNDSLSYYNELFAKQGITRQQFMETIEWYVNHPDQYKDLYTKVINLVAKYEEDERIRWEVAEVKDSNDIWNLKTEFHLPLEGERNPIAFEIEDTLHGTFTLSSDITYYEDDRSENPRMTLILEYDDGTTDDNTILGITKDGKERNISVTVKSNTNKKLVKIRGWLLDHSDNTEHKHVDCYHTTLKRTQD